MSKGNELYVRKSRSSDPAMVSDAEDQMWDDSSMTAAYDKAVNLANEEIAKQIAMETNSKFKDNAKSNESKVKAPSKSPKTQRPKTKVWAAGMPCRAVFYEDEEEYEAVVYSILDNRECLVKFLGYGNSEVVNIDSLKESHGDEPRMRQIEMATGNKFDDGFESLSNGETSDFAATYKKVRKEPKKRSRKPKAKKPAEFPDFHQALPNLDHFPMPASLAGLPLPFPPPPPPGSFGDDLEDQALSPMLLSWYMSGYHAGMYKGLKLGRASCDHCTQ